MVTRSCQLWGTLLLSITTLSFELGSGNNNGDKCISQCNNDPCNLLKNFSGGNYACFMKCKGKGCKQTCDTGVELCEMDLECESNDCDQTCKAKTCKLNCSGSKCKMQSCKGNRNACEMNLECNGPDCDQTCIAETCKLNCSGSNCKMQSCKGSGNACEMNLECNGQDCDQTCNAKTCKLNCSGNKCKMQSCEGNGIACEMNLECNGPDCDQTCNAETCKLNCSGSKCKMQRCKGDKVKVCNMHCNANDCTQECDGTCTITRTWPTSSHNKLICSGNGKCCGSLMLPSESWSLTTRIFQTCSGEDKSCICTKFSDTHRITSDLYTSNAVTSVGASTIRVFATKTSKEHGTKAYNSVLLQSTLQSPLSLISPSPLPSSSSHPHHASATSSTVSRSSSKPTATSALTSGSASESSAAASSPPVLPVGASASSSTSSSSSSKQTATSGSSSASSSVAASSLAVLSAVASTSSSALSPSSSKPTATFALASASGSSAASSAAISSSPSAQTPLSSKLEEIKNLVKQCISLKLTTCNIAVCQLYCLSSSQANDSTFELKGGGNNRILSLMEAIRVFEDFITSIQILRKHLTEEEIKIARNSIFKVAVALEVFALNYGKHQMIGANSSVEINSRKLVLAIQKTYRKSASDFCLGKQELQTSLEVSSRNFANNASVVVGIMYKDLHEVLITDQPFRTITGTTRYLDSWITAVALDPKPEKLKENVILRFRNLKIGEGEKKCMFWSGLSESSSGFSETGCYLFTSKSNSEETVCSCNHLTHFAVLLDYYNGSPGLTEEDETILEIITYVGLSLSIFAILLTIILYSYLTDVWQPLTQIRLSLSVSLGAGQIIFLTGINATENTALCVLAAAFLQYFLMAAFCWMLVEGIYFFLFVVKVYNINTKMHMYHFISWGLPVIMVSISIGIAAGKDGIKSYTSEKYCWLSSTNNLIWIFVTFVAFIEVLNILILVRVIKEMSTLMQPTGENNRTQKIRLGIKTCAVMIPVLGVTWLFGLLVSLHKAFAYIFTIFNSTQGILIFVLHCVRNSQIRERLKRKMNIIFPSAADHGNSAKKNSQVNPIDAGEVCAVKLQSFKE